MNKFLIGTSLGVIIGLLIAPEKGEDTREKLVDTAEKLKKGFDKLTGHTGPGFEEVELLFQEKIEGLTDDVRHRILTILQESKEKARLKTIEINGVV